MRVLDLPQGSEAWLAARAGKVTASRINDVLSRSRDRKNEGSTRRNYKAQIIAERLSGRPQENGFQSKAMENGLELEPLARSAYEVAKGVLVDLVGFVLHPSIERSGASPDALVGTDGVLEIKAPFPATHIGYLLAGEVPTEYENQILWQLACTERAWVDFVSYCPAFPPHLQLFIARFNRDDARILEITAEVNVFLREVDEIIERLNRKAA